MTNQSAPNQNSIKDWLQIWNQFSALQEWYDDLLSVSLELSSGQLIKNMTMYPTMQITLVHPDMTREFEQACQVTNAGD